MQLHRHVSVNIIVDPKEEARHRSLLRRYLIVYLLATLSDWLQDPYVYALYDAYGYSQHAIAAQSCWIPNNHVR
jgi:Sugar-tranasporters, 12 TM